MNDAREWTRGSLHPDGGAVRWDGPGPEPGTFMAAYVPLAVEDLIRAPLQSRLEALEAVVEQIYGLGGQSSPHIIESRWKEAYALAAAYMESRRLRELSTSEGGAG